MKNGIFDHKTGKKLSPSKWFLVRQLHFMKRLWPLALIAIVFGLIITFWGFIIYVAHHFITKYW